MGLEEAVEAADTDAGDVEAADVQEAGDDLDDLDVQDGLGDRPDRDADPDPDRADRADDQGGFTDWATRVPEGSYRDFELRDYWDPENGGEKRIAFHVADFADVDGVPNIVGVLLGLAEMWFLAMQSENGRAGGSENDGGGAATPKIRGSSA